MGEKRKRNVQDHIAIPIFEGLALSVSRRVPNYRSICRKIIERQGRVVENRASHTILPAGSPAVVGLSCFSVDWILECVEAGALLDSQVYRSPVEIGAKRPAKTTKNAFTPAEIDMLREYVADAVKKGSALQGNKLYEEFAKQHPQHTAQSWREKARKLVLPDAPFLRSRSRSMMTPGRDSVDFDNRSPKRPRLSEVLVDGRANKDTRQADAHNETLSIVGNADVLRGKSIESARVRSRSRSHGGERDVNKDAVDDGTREPISPQRQLPIGMPADSRPLPESSSARTARAICDRSLNQTALEPAPEYMATSAKYTEHNQRRFPKQRKAVSESELAEARVVFPRYSEVKDDLRVTEQHDEPHEQVRQYKPEMPQMNSLLKNHETALRVSLPGAEGQDYSLIPSPEGGWGDSTCSQRTTRQESTEGHLEFHTPTDDIDYTIVPSPEGGWPSSKSQENQSTAKEPATNAALPSQKEGPARLTTRQTRSKCHNILSTTRSTSPRVVITLDDDDAECPVSATKPTKMASPPASSYQKGKSAPSSKTQSSRLVSPKKWYAAQTLYCQDLPQSLLLTFANAAFRATCGETDLAEDVLSHMITRYRERHSVNDRSPRQIRSPTQPSADPQISESDTNNLLPLHMSNVWTAQDDEDFLSSEQASIGRAVKKHGLQDAQKRHNFLKAEIT